LEQEPSVIITSITEHPRRKGRYVVDVDGREAAVLTAETLSTLGARVGAALGEAQLEALRQASAEVAVLDRALNLLAHRARSARELRRRLLQKGEPPALIDAALERLERMGLIDDAEYARQVARSKVMAQGASKRRVRQELFKRGVASELADAAIEEVYEDEAVDPGEIVERAARKRLQALGGLDPETRRRRLYGFLARRGYESDEIRAAMQTVLGEADVEGDGETPDDE
jgi:regulatory protein